MCGLGIALHRRAFETAKERRAHVCNLRVPQPEPRTFWRRAIHSSDVQREAELGVEFAQKAGFGSMSTMIRVATCAHSDASRVDDDIRLLRQGGLEERSFERFWPRTRPTPGVLLLGPKTAGAHFAGELCGRRRSMLKGPTVALDLTCRFWRRRSITSTARSPALHPATAQRPRTKAASRRH